MNQLIYSTAQEILDEVKVDLDLQEETFITDAELLKNLQKAVERAEQLVHGIYEDYFLVPAKLTLVNGVSDLDLPSDVYAHKIRRIQCNKPADKYEVTRVKRLERLLDVENSDRYRYMVINYLSSGPKLRFFPTPQEDNTTEYDIWYLRNARTITLGTDFVDIPEATNFLKQYLKNKCWEKEGHPNLAQGIQDLAKEELELVTTLSAMVPDEDLDIEVDMSIYEEMT